VVVDISNTEEAEEGGEVKAGEDRIENKIILGECSSKEKQRR